MFVAFGSLQAATSTTYYEVTPKKFVWLSKKDDEEWEMLEEVTNVLSEEARAYQKHFWRRGNQKDYKVSKEALLDRIDVQYHHHHADGILDKSSEQKRSEEHRIYVYIDFLEAGRQ